MKLIFSILILLSLAAFAQILGPILSGNSGAGTASTNVARWAMSDGSGTTVTDSSTSSNNLTITPGGGSWTTLGGTNGVYAFDGSSTYMTAANYTNVNFNYNQPFSIFAVGKFIANSAYSTIISRLNSASNYQGYEFDIGFHTPNYVAEFFMVNTYTTNALQLYCNTQQALTAGTLYDLLVTYDGSHTAAGTKIYINGAICTNYITTFNSLTTTTTNTVPLNVGRRPGASPVDYFDGDLGPVYIWNRVLTSGEATTLHGNFYATIN